MRLRAAAARPSPSGLNARVTAMLEQGCSRGLDLLLRRPLQPLPCDQRRSMPDELRLSDIEPRFACNAVPSWLPTETNFNVRACTNVWVALLRLERSPLG